MIKNRSREIIIGITSVIIVAFLVLYLEGEPIEIEPGIIGYAVYEVNAEPRNDVIVSGIEFKAVSKDKTYYYIFDNGDWYESKKQFEWEKRVDMGSDLWQGLYYLKSYDAKIYFNDEEIKDITEFARKW